MDDIRVPITVFSYLPHSVVATPNGGFIYVGGAGGLKIGYIGNVESSKPVIDHFNAFSTQTIRAIDCDPDWSEHQQFAVLTSNNLVHIWDVNKKEPVCGHRALEKPAASQSLAGAMCYLKTKKVMAVDSDRCVIYCASSNTFSLSTGGALLKNNTITLLKACPFDSTIVAAGTKNGLVLISKVSDLSILHKLRGHDTEITSIDWIQLTNIASTPASRTKKVAKSRRKQVPIVDSGDMFDIYSFDYLENEFGTLSNVNPIQEESRLNVSTQQNEDFDFVEACQSLKEDILRPTKPEDDENEVQQSEIPEFDASGSDCSNSRSEEYVEVNDSLRQLDLADIDDHPPRIQTEVDSILSVVTASREPFMWIWNLNTGAALEKIPFKSSQKASEVKFQGLTARWVDEKTLITNSPNGDLIKYTVALTDNKLTYTTLKDTFKEKLIFNFALDRTNKHLWAVSLKRSIVCTDLQDLDKTLMWNSTLAEKLYTIQESPHDMNKIAVAGKTRSIYILDASAFSPHNMKTVVYANRIKAKVICIAWHPAFENLLAFSTSEGRVGVLDVNKVTNFPIIMKPFTSEEVYKITWGLITEKSNATPHWALFASSKTKLVYFPDKDKVVKYLCEDKQISTVVAGKKWLCVGSQDGSVYILKLNGLEITCSSNVSNRYVSDCAWNPNNENILAVSADTPDIHLFDCSDADNGAMNPIGVLKGHCKGGVPLVKWSNEDEHKLLSTGFDGTVRVWNTKTLECVSLFQSRGPTFCASFWPKDENFVICSGYNESLFMFDTRNRMDEWIAKPVKDKPDDLKWAVAELTDSQQLLSLEKKLNRKVARKVRRSEVAKLADGLQNVELDSPPIDTVKREPIINLELNRTTVLYLSNKEFNKSGIEILNELLLEPDDPTYGSLHRLLFSGKEEARQLLEIELQNHKDSTTDSIGHVFIPQLNVSLETEINEMIASKRLTSQHVSLAPMISFSFWKKCCKALADQYVEKSCILLAIPYLLAIHEINDAIKRLIEGNYYREAWIVAKVHKESEDQQFFDIASAWATFLEEHGNLDGAALVSYSAGKYETAAAFLSKKRTKTEEVEKMIEMLNKRI
ncbi:protein rigor mortis [Bradysia coprophila]|uniref:protein rigor mortis n=1 Tax=Bradysia coprophila TaxID=38358 RepID=UPI00187D94FC|nr:protein rigor mortis [Bradysia coprophila]XP_037035515.1 protein rigor mortis [Bradysia coprophila]